jgi:hypothetical protein
MQAMAMVAPTARDLKFMVFSYRWWFRARGLPARAPINEPGFACADAMSVKIG